MKRLLTYGWLLLTLLDSLFVMPSCQEEDTLSETTEVMMTFTTRAFVDAVQSGDDPNNTFEQEKMKDLRVIMVRANGDIVGNKKVTGITKNSVTFKFNTQVIPSGEDFTFFAIANENSIIPTNEGDLAWLKRGDEGDLDLSARALPNFTDDELTAIKNLTVGNNAAYSVTESNPIPQTNQWTVKVKPYESRDLGTKRLDFVGSKIAVVFENNTGEAQSLSDICIEGITPNTKGYLFKDDFVDSKLQENATDVTTIHFGGINLAAAATDSVAPYYTYPVNNISGAVLKATWGDETKDLNLDGINSIGRNQYLRIKIILNPAGDMTMTYQIAEWEDKRTDIGSIPPTTNKDDYGLLGWEDNKDISIGGTTTAPEWNLGIGGTIMGEEIETNWEGKISKDGNNYLELDLPTGINLLNDKVLVYFRCYRDNGAKQEFGENFEYELIFKNDSGIEITETDSTENQIYTWIDYDLHKNQDEYVRYLTLDQSVLNILNRGNNASKLIVQTHAIGDTQNKAVQILISKLTLIKPI